MGGSVIVVGSRDEFQKHLNGGKGVFVDFFAEWCGPCKKLAPVLDKLASENPDVVFLKVDVDECQDLAKEYKISAMPTMIGFADGKPVGTVVGAKMPDVTALIEKLKPVAFSGSAQTTGGASADDPREASAKAAMARMAGATAQ